MHIECNCASYGVTPHEMVSHSREVHTLDLSFFNTLTLLHKHLPLIFHAINSKKNSNENEMIISFELNWKKNSQNYPLKHIIFFLDLLDWELCLCCGALLVVYRVLDC